MIFNKRFSFLYFSMVILHLLITFFLRTQKIIFHSEIISYFRYILVFNILLCLICQNLMYWCHSYPSCTLVCTFSHYTYIRLIDLHCCWLYYIIKKSIAESEHILQYDKIIFHAYSHSCTITLIIFVKMTDFNVCTTWLAMYWISSQICLINYNNITFLCCNILISDH